PKPGTTSSGPSGRARGTPPNRSFCHRRYVRAVADTNDANPPRADTGLVTNGWGQRGPGGLREAGGGVMTTPLVGRELAAMRSEELRRRAAEGRTARAARASKRETRGVENRTPRASGILLP